MPTKRKITLSKDKVRNKDVSHLKEYFTYRGDEFYFDQPAGECEFRLYAELSDLVNNTTILDIGTRYGGSALALSHNPNNQVITYDVVEWESHSKLRKDNIDMRIGNFMEDSSIDYNDVDIIMIDVDPHDGLQEPPMIQFLEEKGWVGILLLDDISTEGTRGSEGQIDPWPAIREMWEQLPYEKYDVTDIGHFSGTGLINFGNKFDFKLVG